MVKGAISENIIMIIPIKLSFISQQNKRIFMIKDRTYKHGQHQDAGAHLGREFSFYSLNSLKLRGKGV